MHLKSMSLFVLSTFNCSFTCLLSNTLKTLSKNFMEYPFLKNIVFNFSTSLKNNSRVEQMILALLSAPRITPFFQVTGHTASKFSKTSVLVLFLYTQDSKSFPLIQILVSRNAKTLFTLSSTVNLMLLCW